MRGCGYDIEVFEEDPGRYSSVDVPACPVCGAGSARPTFRIEEPAFELVTCVGCGLGRLHPLPDPELIRSFYPAEYYGSVERKFQPMVEALVRAGGLWRGRGLAGGLSPGARILDLGCGRGVLLGAMADRGMEVHALEISQQAARGADPRAEIRIAWQLSEAGYPREFFDRVVLWHVLEHMADPRETLLEVHRILRPLGRVVIAVPNFSSAQARWSGAAWFHLDLPRHLFHFPLPALVALLESCGFRCRTRHHFSWRQNPFGWVQSALNRSDRFSRNGLYELLQGAGDKAGLSRREKFWLRLVYWSGMPLAVGVCAITTLLRTGATVCVVAEK